MPNIKLVIGGVITTAAIGSALIATDIHKEIPDPPARKSETAYNPSEHNLKGVEYEEIRTAVDHRYREAHDALSEAYYEKLPFIWRGNDYGTLTQQQFDALQALIWLKYELLLASENEKSPAPNEKLRSSIQSTSTAQSINNLLHEIPDIVI